MEMHFVEKYLKKGDVFADVGANIGSWALFAASCEAYAYAIEPTPSTFELLKMNVELNPRLKDNIEMVNVAIGDKVGELLFAIDSDSENHVVSTEEAGREIIHVSCDTLDNLCEKNLEVAKIDVENFEIPALKGAKNMLMQGNPNVIIIEAFENYNDIKDLLSGYGYRQFKYDSVSNALVVDSKRSTGNNVMFIKDVNRVIDRLGCSLEE